MLLGQGVDITDIDKDGDTPLHIAIHEHHIDMARMLIDRKANLIRKKNFQGFTPLQLACFHGHLDTQYSLPKDFQIHN